MEVASTRDPLPGDDGARLEGLAPVGGVLIGAETFERLPDGAVASHGPACA
jgi:class 3 adenylate cyclase